MELYKKQNLVEYNENESWFKSFENIVEVQWNKDVEETYSSSKGKIILPEEDIDQNNNS